ncbi:Myosin XI-2 [Dorcoceras hygrometricum]|uniref:Myosin XI-2 n=1 Tax=Dorcoceras hygrometricum TaxID=472368 RepID=A0A2Z7AJ92_9LAMI|nr:Myosin XI-2 [Dorcoceras hygrometricum]
MAIVQYGPFNSYIPIDSTTIGISSIVTERINSAGRLCAYVQSAGAKNQQVATVLPVENLFVSAVATLPVVVKSSRKKSRSRQSEEIQPVARFSRKIQQKRKRSSSRLESAEAKQLTNYQRWMSTAELNSKWRKRQ